MPPSTPERILQRLGRLLGCLLRRRDRLLRLLERERVLCRRAAC